MKRSTKPRRTRWPRTQKQPAAPSAGHVGRPPHDEVRDLTAPALGPYEAVYDVCDGYAHDRSIVIP